MENTTTKQKKYLSAWNSYINGLTPLFFTPSKKLSEEVSEAIEHLKHLAYEVSIDKGL